MKILALKYRGLGDTVLWSASLSALCELFPQSEIHLAYPENYKELYENDPRFHQKWLLKKPLSSFFKPLKKENFDYVLNFHASSGTSFFSSFLGKKRWIHPHERGGKNFFRSQKIINLGKPMPAIERDLNVIRSMGWQGPSPKTQLNLSEEYLEKGKKICHSYHLNSEKLILISPLASRKSKLWGFERYFELSKKLKEKNYEVCWVAQNLEDIPKFYQKKDICIIETPSLKELLSLLTVIYLYVGSDSGIKHLCVALNKHSLTLFGPESISEWHGYDMKTHPVISHSVLCRNKDPIPAEFSWCDKEICPFAGHACMLLTSVEDVYEVILKKCVE